MKKDENELNSKRKKKEMISIIFAGSPTQNKNFYGIGYEGKIPWKIPEDQKIFKNLTMNNTVIVGKDTYESLPCISGKKLPGREIFIVSQSLLEKVIESKEKLPLVCTTLEEAVDIGLKYQKHVFICGGKRIYEEALSENFLKKYEHFPINLHFSELKKEYECDRSIGLFLNSWCLRLEIEDKEFTYKNYIYDPKGEKQYLDALLYLTQAAIRKTRNGSVFSHFFEHMCFDLTKSFPLLTTKKVFVRGILEELFFFLRGDTDVKILQEKGVKIWDKNTSREFLDKIGKKDRDQNVMGPMYGYQWRFFNQEYDEKTRGPKEVKSGRNDQLAYVINEIKNSPESRRIIMTSFNPLQAEDGVLYPCHSILIQFYVEGKFLDMLCYNRSQDIFLGVPFNIASAGFLLMIIAKITGLFPRTLRIVMGDVHLYEKHLEQAKEQLSRTRYTFPTVKLLKNLNTLKDIEELCVEDFAIENYRSHKAIPAEMIA